ncbi:MAG: hypothetical protein RIS35_1464, partial [Pseudomonadota bacterium]
LLDGLTWQRTQAFDRRFSAMLARR